MKNEHENITPKNGWGGAWTEKKLDAFEKYVNAYLTIMNRNSHKFGWKLIYFDGFAGSGSRSEQNEQSSVLMKDLFDQKDITSSELNVYKGAAERVAALDKKGGFDYYYFIDYDYEASEALKTKLSKYNLDNPQFRVGDANEYLKEMAEFLKTNTKYRGLILLDPFGMQVDWDSISQFKDLKVDMFVLIPTGMIVNRLLDRKGKLLYTDKLESFFGLPKEKIQKMFYQEHQEQNLFGEEETIIEKINHPIQKIAEIYIQQLKTMFKYVSPKPLVLKNSKNVPIYHFAFASQNQTAVKIAQDIIGKE